MGPSNSGRNHCRLPTSEGIQARWSVADARRPYFHDITVIVSERVTEARHLTSSNTGKHAAETEQKKKNAQLTIGISTV